MAGRLAICLLLAVAALPAADEELEQQVRELRQNVSHLWSFVEELRTAVSTHLVHLRVHQAALEHAVQHSNSLGHGDEDSHSGEEHSYGSGHSYSGEQHSHSHSHSGEQHSHSGEQHSHGSSYSHSGEQHSHGSSYSHSGEQHSHGSSYSHSGEQHSHGGGHSHSGEQHSHGSSYSHSGQHSHAGSHSHRWEPHSHGSSSSHNGDDHYSESPSYGFPSETRSKDSSSSLDLMKGLSFHGHRRQRNRTTVEKPKYADYAKYEFGVCELPPDSSSGLRGHATFWQTKRGGKLNVHVLLQGLGPGQAARLRVHDEGCAGPHRAVADFGSVEANVVFSDAVASLTGPLSIVGKALLVQVAEDEGACCVIRRVDKLPIRSHKALALAPERSS